MPNAKLTALLLDLDGTLLPMDQEKFTHAYFKLLAQRMAPEGYEPDALVKAIWAGTAAMVKNDGGRTNEEAFWARFEELCGARARADRAKFDRFYEMEFQQARAACGFTLRAAELISLARGLGLRLILATNPIFPRYATESRVRWAGLEPSDFEWITSYENCRYSKPNPEYYREIAQRLRLDPAACLMVGNDAEEDGAAAEAGMRVFLLTDCLINARGLDLSALPCGGFDALEALLREEAM